MKIVDFNAAVLSKIKRILDNTSPRPDRRCYGNIEHILEHKLFGHSHTGADVRFKHANDLYVKFSKEVSSLVSLGRYPKGLFKNTLQAFDEVCKNNSNTNSHHTGYSKHTSTKQNSHSTLIEVFKDTLQSSRRFKNSISTLKRNTKCYHTDQEGLGDLQMSYPGQSTQQVNRARGSENNEFATQFGVLNQDTFVVAQEMISQKLNPLIVNLANRISPGGGVVKGSRAQEEDLMRRSNYYFALSQSALAHEVTQGLHKGRKHYNHPIPEFGSIYTPEVCVFKDQNYKRLPVPFNVSCIAMAGYDLGKIDKLSPSEKTHLFDASGEISMENFITFTQRKIRHILDVALQEGHSDLVLGALSCGAFKLKNEAPGQTARAVALAYRQVFEEDQYRNKFRTVNFAILDANPGQDTNFTIFSEMFADLKNAQDHYSAVDFTRHPSEDDEYYLQPTPGLYYSNKPIHDNHFYADEEPEEPQQYAISRPRHG